MSYLSCYRAWNAAKETRIKEYSVNFPKADITVYATPHGPVFVKTLAQDENNDGGESYSIREEHAKSLDSLVSDGYGLMVWLYAVHHGYHLWKKIKSDKKLPSFKTGKDGHRFAAFYPGRGLTGQQFEQKYK